MTISTRSQLNKMMLDVNTGSEILLDWLTLSSINQTLDVLTCHFRAKLHSKWYDSLLWTRSIGIYHFAAKNRTHGGTILSLRLIE